MPLHATTVRFSDDLWALLEQEALGSGVSVAQFVRDAALLRVAAVRARRGESDADEALLHLATEAVERKRRPSAVVRDPRRLKAVRDAGLLEEDSRAASFDRLTRVAAGALNAPVALVSIVDEERQLLRGCVGVAEPWATSREMPLSLSYCQHALPSPDPLIVSDAREHPDLRDSRAIAEVGAIAYAGVPLVIDGHVLGTLCVIDHKRREWTTEEIALLREIADAVVEEIKREARAPS